MPSRRLLEAEVQAAIAALTAMASRPEWCYLAPDAEDLAAIYRAIAVTIPCPPGAFWDGR